MASSSEFGPPGKVPFLKLTDPRARARQLHQLFPKPGQLFTNYFLEEGILQTTAWQESLSQSAGFDALNAQSSALLENAAAFHSINEASTEMELIRPLFELLCWNHYLPQQGTDQNIPDQLLFGDAGSKENAVNKPATCPPASTPSNSSSTAFPAKT